MAKHKHNPDDDACIKEADEVEPGSAHDSAIWEGKCLVTGETVVYEVYNNGKTNVLGTRRT